MQLAGNDSNIIASPLDSPLTGDQYRQSPTNPRKRAARLLRILYCHTDQQSVLRFALLSHSPWPASHHSCAFRLADLHMRPLVQPGEDLLPLRLCVLGASFAPFSMAKTLVLQSHTSPLFSSLFSVVSFCSDLFWNRDQAIKPVVGKVRSRDFSAVEAFFWLQYYRFTSRSS